MLQHHQAWQHWIDREHTLKLLHSLHQRQWSYHHVPLWSRRSRSHSWSCSLSKPPPPPPPPPPPAGKGLFPLVAGARHPYFPPLLLHRTSYLYPFSCLLVLQSSKMSSSASAARHNSHTGMESQACSISCRGHVYLRVDLWRIEPNEYAVRQR